MSQILTSLPGASTGRSLPKPPSIFRTGARLPEVRWATVALVLFLLGGIAQLAGAPAAVWWSLYLTCYAAGGWDPALSGLRALREKILDVDLLMIVAAIAAAAIGQVFEGALLIVIFATSGAMEALVTQRTADSVSSLLDLAPERATRVPSNGTGTEEEVDTADLQVGDVILVRPGERIGADGTVIRGVSEVDQAAMTGESVPVVRREGDEVLSGTVNGSGVLSVRVAKAAKDSVVSRIVTLVEEASATKAKTQLFIEKVEQRYSLGVIVATLLVFFLPLSLGESLEAALLRAITFMIVASPCAVVLSTMPPLLAAIANAGRHGVLVKSATVMEQVGRTTVVAFDKTGTLTEGTPKVTAVDSLEAAFTPAEILGLAAAVEQYSEHPLGRAILRDAREKSLTVEPATNFQAVPGQGVSGIVHGRQVRVERPEAEADDDVAGTVVYVIIDGATVGRITLADRLRPTAAATVDRLHQITGNPVHLLTGDNHRAAAQIAAETGIDEVRSRLLPADKATAVRQMEQGGHRVLLIGDGVNDAPALAAATTGIAMGRHGSDLALDTADAIIVRDELEALPSLIAMSKRAHRYIIANLAIAATFITVLVTWDLISILPLPLAVAGHEGSTVIVALNGLRLLRSQAWKN
ncbi:cadmium-translocating P-type ATPase [Arthrobacter echini]|uniref:Cadmium-translocating P-type ATPase n=2 Tax=Arthrobacter echini TaxID=1529066 RepID=A0A5D0XL22_9MICC|nr:heavy metal translocating P-type ATPase [Arthrobacter echini]THJ64697.1 cadmium-translocating P-type ATPase [Arthrobacter echini]TYC97120.1 cadmium-translocating P-type ATPase [Arthrobacter echini]